MSVGYLTQNTYQNYIKLKKIFILLILLGGLVAATGTYLIFGPNVRVNKHIITVPPGTSAQALRDSLQPYVRQTLGFELAARLKKFRRPKPGRYLIRRGMSSNELINMFRSGRQKPVRITFNNIPDLPHLAGKLSRALAADSADLLRAMTDDNFLQSHGFNRQTALLMYVPNTYKVYYFISPEGLRRRMWKEYQRFWNDSRRARARKLGLSPVQVGILASIVQKESNDLDEQGRIARVYLNRLKKDMRLQADPTVVYAYRLVTGDTTVIRRVLKKHLAVDSPYNTYKYKGLPPGPITMPDRATIDAVLNAPQHSYLYFSADPGHPGRHLFARTWAEHLRNAQRYRKHLNKNKIFH